jgi:hypothetical protein
MKTVHKLVGCVVGGLVLNPEKLAFSYYRYLKDEDKLVNNIGITTFLRCFLSEGHEKRNKTMTTFVTGTKI